MESKRLLVLANSMKKEGRCVAGREISLDQPPRPLGWVRPVSGEGEGELLPHHMRLGRTTPLVPLELVEVPFLRHAADPVHPEDWVVAGTEWKAVKNYPPAIVLKLLESPDHLWLESKAHPDRVTPEYLLKSKPARSICLVRVNSVQLRFWREFNQFKGYNQKKTRAVFRYNGVEYNLGLTDPVATAAFCQAFPEIGDPPIEVTPDMPHGCALCISLTPPFNGYQYKVVATVLALP
jgi:hypothetical protein